MTAPGGDSFGSQLWVSILPSLQGLQERFKQAGTQAGNAMGESARDAMEQHLSQAGGGVEQAGRASGEKFAESYKGAFAARLGPEMFTSIGGIAERASDVIRGAGTRHGDTYRGAFATRLGPDMFNEITAAASQSSRLITDAGTHHGQTYRGAFATILGGAGGSGGGADMFAPVVAAATSAGPTIENLAKAHASRFLSKFRTEMESGSSAGGPISMASTFEQMLGGLDKSFAQSGKNAHRQFLAGLQPTKLIPTTEEMHFDQHFAEYSQRFGVVGQQLKQSLTSGIKGGGGEGGGIVNALLDEFVPAKWQRVAQMFTKQGMDMGKMHADAIKEETAKLGPGMLPTFEAVGKNVEGKMAETGKLAGAAMKVGLVGAAVIAAEEVLHTFENIAKMIEEDSKIVWEVGKEGANVAMDGIVSIIQGKTPDVGAAVNVIEDAFKGLGAIGFNAINTEIDNTVGHIPILGDVVKSTVGEAEAAFGALFAVFDEGKQLAGTYISTLIEIGDTWTDVKRTIVGQTLMPNEDLENGLDRYVNIVRDISASGALVWFGDVAKEVGELDQRLSGLSGGVGLTNGQLEELSKTVAEGNEALGGIKINIDNLSAAMNSFDVPADQVNEQLTTLVNISRLTGANINEMLTDLDAVAPSMQALGYNMDSTAFMMGKLNEELGKPAMNRMAFGISQIEERLHKMGIKDIKEGWAGVLDVTEKYIAAGDHASAVDYLKNFVGSSRTAETMIEGVSKGVIDTAEKMQAMFDNSGQLLHQPLDEVLEATKTLEDSFHQLGNQAMAALEPLGVGVMTSMEGVTNHISDWLKKNQDQVIGWATSIGHWILTAVSAISGFVHDVLHGAAPLVEDFVHFVAGALSDLDVVIQSHFAVLSHLPGVGHFFGDWIKPLQDATIPLEALRHMRIDQMMNDAADGANNLAEAAKNLQGPLSKLGLNSLDTSKLQEGLTAPFSADGKSPSKLDMALSPETKDGLKLLGDKKTWDQVQAQMSKLGIDLTIGADGQIQKIVTKTKAEADNLENYLRDVFGKDKLNADIFERDIAPKVKIEASAPPPPPPPSTSMPKPGDPTGPLPWLPPSSSTGPVPAPLTPLAPQAGAHPSSYIPVPGQIDIQPAAFNKTVTQVQDSAGIPLGMKGPLGVQLPTALDVVKPQNESSKDFTMDAAGIPKDYQGQIKGASDQPGVSLPTGLDVKKDSDQQSPSDMMDAIGIPAAFQGENGITIPAGFSMTSGIPIPGGFPSGGPGAPSGPLSGGVLGPYSAQQSDAARMIIQLAQQRGFSPDQTKAILSTAIDESHLKQSAVGGGGKWHGIFQQDSGYANRDDMAGNIQGFFDKLGPPPTGDSDIWEKLFATQQGTAYGSPLARSGYMGEIKAHQNEAGDLYGLATAGQSAAGAPGMMPAGFGGGGSGHSPSGVNEVIFANNKTGQLTGAAGGQPVGPGTSQPGYYRNDWKDHHGHVHTSFDTAPDGSFYGLAKGTDIRPGAGGFPPWVYALGAQYGLLPSTYPGHQEGSGYNRGIDWWPALTGKAHQDMSGDSYSDSEDSQLQSFASSLSGVGASGGGAAPSSQSDYWHTDDSSSGRTAAPASLVSQSGFPANFQPADYSTNSGGPTIQAVDRHTGGGGKGPKPIPYPARTQVQAPNTPGSRYTDTQPPPGMAHVAPDTPGAIQTPYGWFVYANQMPQQQQDQLKPEDRQKFDEWLDKYATAIQTGIDAQTRINEAQDALTAAQAKRTEKDQEYQDLIDTAIKDHIDPNSDAFAKTPTVVAAKKAKDEADKEAARDQRALDKANTQATADARRAEDQGDQPPPWEKTGATKSTPGDPNADQLGKGLVQGILQELGFPDVFGKPPNEWGISKLLMGGAGYGMGILQNMTRLGPGGLGDTTGGVLDPTSGGGNPGGGGPLLGGLAQGMFPNLAKVFGAPQGNAGPNASAAPPTGPVPSPSDAPGSLFTAPPPPGAAPGPGNQPAGYGGPAMIVNQNNSGIMNIPDAHATIKPIATATSSPHIGAGAGGVIPT